MLAVDRRPQLAFPESLVIHPTRSRGHARWVPAVVLGLCALAGCGTDGRLPTHPVKGKLTLDGKPVANAEIWLVPRSEDVKNAKLTVRPYAKSGADGTFTLTSYVADDGAPAGEYAVMVQKVGGAEPDAEADPETPQPTKGRPKTFAATVQALQNSALPGKYGNP